MTAPVGDASNEQKEYLTDDKIDNLHSHLKETPGLSSTAVANFIEILKKFRKETPINEKKVGVVSLVLFLLLRRLS